MNRCCKDAVKHAVQWQLDEGEVECDWCGTYVAVETVQSELLGTWPAPDPLQQQGASYLPGWGKHAPRTLLNGGKTTQFFPPFGPKWTAKGETLPIARTGLGLEPPRHPSPARQAFRDWLISDVFGGSDVEVDGTASLIADMISYSLECRDEQRKRGAANLSIEAKNLLHLIADQNPQYWETITIQAINTPGPFTAVGWATEANEVLSVAVTGSANDVEAEDLAQFFEAMPEFLQSVVSYLRKFSL